MERYSKINEKRKREIVLLRGTGCVYKKCAFCDYHYDKCADTKENFALNKEVLSNVTGEYGDLEVINSGSVFELDERTLELIKETCLKKKISVVHFEAHYLYRNKIPALRKDFSDFELKLKLGLESFDHDFRENILKKGISEKDPKIISEHFDEANFLLGVSGQSAASMEKDIETGLKYFERICLNIMCGNSTPILPDKAVISDFVNLLYPKYKDDYRVDILLNNTDFGVGD
ncbi:MAG: radical SAM protein [Ruminococcaceae bacterium]|nr:radical SAM protein [Oscillospiraceae bacterium]